MVGDYHKMTHALKKHHQSSRGFIKLISIPILTHYGLIDKIVEFQKQYPQIIIETSEQHTGEIQRAMKNDEADVYFLRPQQFQESDDYNMRLLVEDELALVVSAGHPLADRKEASLLEVSDDDFLLFWYGTSTYHLFVDACRNAGFVPKTDTSYLSIDTILRMVADDKGVSLVAKKVAEYLLNPKLRVIRLKEKTELNTLVFTKKNNTNPVLEEFLEHMKAE
jgi:DNA-binding transcriptional LysR family regulator